MSGRIVLGILQDQRKSTSNVLASRVDGSVILIYKET